MKLTFILTKNSEILVKDETGPKAYPLTDLDARALLDFLGRAGFNKGTGAILELPFGEDRPQALL